jgi:hypothetical protein
MQFSLPTNLQAELVAYDPQLKALARTKKQATTKKSKYPLGNPNDIIPTEVIAQSLLQDAIDNINGVPAADRYQEFTRIETVIENNLVTSKPVTKAILYHYEQCWYAAWLPPKGKKSEYVYGYSYAYKDTATAWKTIPYSVKNRKDETVYKTYGRSSFGVYAQLITREDIENGNTYYNWNVANVQTYYAKSGRIKEIINKFESSLKKTIPTWEDTRGMFDRLQIKCIAQVLFPGKDLKSYLKTDAYTEWLPSVDNIIDMIAGATEQDTLLSYNQHTYQTVLHIINTPFFRKWIQSKCNAAIEQYENKDTNKMCLIEQPFKQLAHLFDRITYIHSIWPDCPLDYYQNNLDVLMGTDLEINRASGTRAIKWLGTHMSVASFFTMLSKWYVTTTEEANSSERHWAYKSTVGLHVYLFRDLSDTLSMLNQVLVNQELEPPKRWRIGEFHDHVQAEAWKIKNPNFSLHQDLFPTPIKVQHQDQQWTFFQPIDTHQLAAWGQAVRNCVGNATNYAEGVRKKQHFIVLCMIDNKPQFTVQLKVSMGMMTVDQIAGISNARLTEEQRESYTKVFGQALQQREKVLASA